MAKQQASNGLGHDPPPVVRPGPVRRRAPQQPPINDGLFGPSIRNGKKSEEFVRYREMKAEQRRKTVSRVLSSGPFLELRAELREAQRLIESALQKLEAYHG